MKAFFFTKFISLPLLYIINSLSKNICLCWFLIFLPISLCAEAILSIRIIGNQYTKEHVILREIQHPVPGELDESVLEKDRNRVYNLGLFSSVDITVQNSVYTVTVVETYRYIPFPMLDYDEGKGFSYGGGIAYINFRGLNEKLIFGMTLGQEKTWFLDFRDPWIAGDHVSISLGVYNFHSDGAVYAYKYGEKGGYAGSGFYRGDRNKYDVKIGFESISLDTTGITPDDRWDLETFSFDYHYLYAVFDYQYDTRDVFVDPTKGHYLILHFKPRFGLKNSQNYYQLGYNYTRYIQITEQFGNPVVSIKSSVFYQTPENIPPFSYVYIGGEDYVRGYSPIPWKNPEQSQYEIEGIHAIYKSIQLQHTLLPRKDYGGTELGIDVVYFLDTGISVKKLKSFNLKNGIVGFGFGFRFFVSGAGVIGVDIGFNPYGSHFIHPTSQN